MSGYQCTECDEVYPTLAEAGQCHYGIGGVVEVDRYKIVRFYQDLNRRKRTMMTGLTLEEAQAHCQREDTHGDGWFDGYEAE